MKRRRVRNFRRGLHPRRTPEMRRRRAVEPQDADWGQLDAKERKWLTLFAPCPQPCRCADCAKVLAQFRELMAARLAIAEAAAGKPDNSAEQLQQLF